MNVYINRDKEIPSIPSKLSGVEFLKVLKRFYFKDITGASSEPFREDEVPVYVSLSIRTTYTNKVFVVQDTVEFNCPLIKIEDLEGYYLIIANIQSILNKNFNMGYMDAMPSSVLQPIGFINMSDCIVVYFQIIVEDKYENGTFILSNIHKSGTFKEISSVVTFTNLSYWSKLILPTLKIVEGNNFRRGFKNA